MKKLIIATLLFVVSSPLASIQSKPLPGSRFCQLQARAAFDRCLISGGSPDSCSLVAASVYNKCIFN